MLTVVLASIAFLSISCFKTEVSTTEKVDKLDELIKTYAEYGKFNGSVLVAEQGEVIYKNGFGMANMEWEIPNTSSTKFRLASVSKQFTAMLIMQLVAENTLDLHTPISRYLPNYPKDKADQITLHHLLTHTSGIPNEDVDGNLKHSPDDLVHVFKNLELDFTPGDRFKYSNSGYVLLGLIIEKVTGERYEEVLKKKIFEPLQMTNSGYDNNHEVIKNRASGYRKFWNGYRNSNYIHMSVPYSAGGLYSTVEDLYLWDRALYSGQLLPIIYLNKLFEGYVKEGVDTYYGYGWDIGRLYVGNTTDHVQSIRHDGVINGFTSFIVRIPSTETLIVLLNNTGRAPLHQMIRSITGILKNTTYDFPKKSLAKSLVKVIESDGVEKGLEFYYKTKDTKTYYLNEEEMNLVGYDLLNAGEFSYAATIFKLNIDEYPRSFNVYDSYGEALMNLGDKVNAIKNYEKSLELNPENSNATKMLLKIKDKC